MNRQYEPTVDVVVPARNEENYLGRLLEAINLQQYPMGRVNVFVVDNGSTDRTVSIAREYGAAVITDQGTVASARNAGVHAGTSELVGMLDGHVIPDPEWLRTMTQRFRDDSIGAVMGRLRYEYWDPIVAELAQYATMTAHRAVSKTYAAEDSPWPWILSGNCMFRRKALEDAGGFNETLFRCEDTDISWRLVLIGYELVYEAQAEAVHHEACSARVYLDKQFNYGIGAAQLAFSYGLSSTLPAPKSDLPLPARILDAYYRAGFEGESSRILNGDCHIEKYKYPRRALAELRPPFVWRDDELLSVAPEIVYFFPTDHKVVMVPIGGTNRFEFEDSAAYLIRCLCFRKCREEIIAALQQVYQLEEETAARDTDEFVELLVEERLVARSQRHQAAPVK